MIDGSRRLLVLRLRDLIEPVPQERLDVLVGPAADGERASASSVEARVAVFLVEPDDAEARAVPVLRVFALGRIFSTSSAAFAPIDFA